MRIRLPGLTVALALAVGAIAIGRALLACINDEVPTTAFSWRVELGWKSPRALPSLK